MGALARLVRDKLRSVDLRPTRQRVSLASLLFVAGDRHVTVDQLFTEAKALRMPLSRATVYNTLHQFVAAGLVREIALYGAKVWYDTKTGSHCHYFDEDVAALYDMPVDLDPSADLPAAQGQESGRRGHHRATGRRRRLRDFRKSFSGLFTALIELVHPSTD